MGLKWISKPKRKKEYSKIIVAIVLSFCIVVTIFSMALMWRTGDTSALAYLIPAVFAETGIVISFYLDKSKKENINKNKKIEGNDLDV
ncbi:hypothetical protein CS063_00115 [Sporanaerobium hydrogeniformans]|uniref:Uncharacterized protein n=1 Tax=Sporanaerobium hydrogeniformans TaxID=3072179 RepID=A0AC61DGT8_9FIRM|nr:hypothetical protein [Sporanaerobium hydrogeniformans]PHV71921.1 hypothetical protein CS063_00115 [Sporanaerobium hydrogeniformans]